MSGGFAKSGNFTGCVFSGGSVTPGFPVFGFADDVEFEVVSGVGEVSGLGVAEAVAAGSLLSLDEVVDCVDDLDWAKPGDESKKTNAAANTRRFIALQSILGSSRNSQRHFTLIRTLQGVWVLTHCVEIRKSQKLQS
jgi:hypothetical protein